LTPTRREGEIRVQVADAGSRTGGDAVVGIEAPGHLAGLQVPDCLTAGYLGDTQAFRFTPPSAGTPVVPASSRAWQHLGRSITHVFDVVNLDPTPVEFALDLSGNTWAARASVASLALEAGEVGTFSVEVDVPASASAGSEDQLTLYLAPVGGGAARQVQVTTTAQQPCLAAGRCPSLCTLAAAPDGTGCDDGNACTEAACLAGVCAPGVSRACPESDECHTAGTCDAVTGTCTAQALPDGTPRSSGVCSSGTCTVADAGPHGTSGCGSVAGAASPFLLLGLAAMLELLRRRLPWARGRGRR
jgi:hypothetical protein